MKLRSTLWLVLLLSACAGQQEVRRLQGDLTSSRSEIERLQAENQALRTDLSQWEKVNQGYLRQADALNKRNRYLHDHPEGYPDLRLLHAQEAPFSDMVLCYGGSPSRGALNTWDAERFGYSVAYTDPAGQEHWLYDGFLAIEPRLWGRSEPPQDVALSQEDMGGKPSGRKEHWEELLSYWVGPDAAFASLDAAIAEVALRIGEPPYKRQVILNLPDAVMHEYFEDLNSSTTYWGDGLDFSRAEDRAAACAWYIDEAIRRFAEAGYRYIELIGFYIHCEEIPTPSKGWRWPWKQMDRYLPLVAEHLHAKGLYLSWIPYFEAASYDGTPELGIDLCWMQPNYYWEGEACPWDRALEMIRQEALGMEFEFDDRLLAQSPEAPEQRRRLQLYLDYARESGLYGSRSFTYFQDHDTMRNLACSSDPGDRAIYDAICQFIIKNPYRQQLLP